MDWMLLAAGTTGLFTFAVHTWIGGPRIAQPLLDAIDLKDTPKYVSYGCWHGMTISLLFMAAAFFVAAVSPHAIELAWFAFAYNVAMMVWSVGLVIWKELGFTQLPHWAMFGTTSIIAGTALLT